MTNRTNTQLYGGTSGVDFGPVTCADGEYINRFYGRSSDVINRLCATCSDGQNLGCYGGGGGYDWSQNQGPYASINGRHGTQINNIQGIGGWSGSPFNAVCPANSVVVGYYGKTNDIVNSLGFVCGVDKQTYCIDNIDEPVCKNIDKSILNKACSKITQSKLPTACYDRKNELTEDVVKSYCNTHLDDPICSCYVDAPKYIPNEIKPLANCWSQTCVANGYQPDHMRNAICPEITLCKEDIGIENNINVNLLTKNITLQKCTVAPPTTDILNNTINDTINDTVKDITILGLNRNIFIIILVLVVFGFIILRKKSNNQSNMNYSSSNMYYTPNMYNPY